MALSSGFLSLEIKLREVEGKFMDVAGVMLLATIGNRIKGWINYHFALRRGNIDLLGQVGGGCMTKKSK